MEDKVITILAIGGTIGHYLMRRSGDFGIWLMRTFKFGWANSPFYTFKSFKGEAATGTEIKFDEAQQKQVDVIVQQRLAREREKFADYEELRKFKTEYEKSQDVVKQKELEQAKNYEEAKKQYEGKLGEFSQKLTAKEQEIQNLRIEHSLTNEISRHNGFIEESIALLKGQVAIDANGNISIKGKDANGLDVSMSLVDGIKKFYEQRPHLVKASFKSGGGTGASDATGTGAGTGGVNQVKDLNYLNAELLKARGVNDVKAVKEISGQIKSLMKSKGINV